MTVAELIASILNEAAKNNCDLLSEHVELIDIDKDIIELRTTKNTYYIGAEDYCICDG